MGVTLQFFAMIMPFGCTLMGFATAVSAQTSWYLVVPLLFVGFEMNIFEAVVLSVLLDLCNGLTLSIINGYRGDVDWRFGTLFGVITAACAVPPALLFREVIEHEQEFVKFTAAFIPAVMAIAFFAKGLRLLKEEKRERLRLLMAKKGRSKKGLSRDSTISTNSSSAAVINIGFDDNDTDDQSLEDGFVYQADHDDDDGDTNNDAEGASNHQHHEDAISNHLQHGSSSDQQFFFQTRPLQIQQTTPIVANKNGFSLLEEFDHEEEEEEEEGLRKNASSIHLSPFQSGSNLLASKPHFHFKKLFSIPYKSVLILTIVGHAFLGLFMGSFPFFFFFFLFFVFFLFNFFLFFFFLFFLFFF
jgi:hypothetical protein